MIDTPDHLINNNPNDSQQQLNVVQGKFKITLQQLKDLQLACENRKFDEEVQFIEQLGGIRQIEQGLHTSFQNGLQSQGETRKDSTGKPLGTQIVDQAEREASFESNYKEARPLKGFWKLFLAALDDFTLKILIVAAIVSIIIEVATAESSERHLAWIDGFAILIAVLVCSLVTAVNDSQKEKQFQKLNNVADARKTLTVIRNGEEEVVHQDYILTGDLIKIIEGMEIPADCLLIKASEVSCDESAMTGETDPIKKNTLEKCIQARDELKREGQQNSAKKHDVPSPFMNAGTKVLNGEGLMVCIIVGKHSSLGKIKEILETNEDTETPLQQKLDKIAKDIGYFGLYSAIAIVVVLLIRFTIERIYENSFETSHIAEVLDYFIIGILVIVVAIPEGLPLAVTLSLAYSVKQMLEEKNLVRQLQACETMGGANTICSDKTGTLTQNVMSLKSWWNESLVTIPNIKGEEDEERKNKKNQEKKEKVIPKDINLKDFMSQQFFDLFLQSTAVNCSATMHPEEKGSKTETALLKFLMRTEFDYRQIRNEFPEQDKFPFSSKRKRMSTFINVNGQERILVKGASEMVLESCNKWISKTTNQVQNLDSRVKQEIQTAIKAMADDCQRTIVLAYADLNGNEDKQSKDENGVYLVEKNGLTLVAVLGIADQVRPEVPHAIEQCKTAGIKVRMVTGDNKDTARAIAREIGIVDKNSSNDLVIEGSEFIKLTGGVICANCRTKECDCVRDITKAVNGKKLRKDIIKNGEAFDKIYRNLCVMARSRPEDKYALVCGLIERGSVVAVTGDGTNDAPALKKADVGFAMGIAGTEVAREAADIILLDDNFKSIINAVSWGRNTYDSVKKFLQFQLTVNVVAVTCTLIGAAVVKMEVLSPLQMLWVNLIMDTLASLALATEPPQPILLTRKPHNRDEYIVSKKMAKHIIGQSIYQIFVILLILFAGEFFLPEVQMSTYLSEQYSEKLVEYISNYGTDTEAYEYYMEQPYKALYHDENQNTVVSGRFRSYSGFDKEYENIYDIFKTYSRHFTYIFNVFVLLQVFNFINARKLLDEKNVFEGITQNWLFIAIVILIFVLQILLVTFLGGVFHCFSFYGLTVTQWLVCVGFGVIGNFISLLLKGIDENKIFKCKLFNIKDMNNQESNKLVQDSDNDNEEYTAKQVPQDDFTQQQKDVQYANNQE